MVDPASFASLLVRAREVKADLEQRIHRQAVERPTWTAGVDARAAGLQDLWNVLRTSELSLVFIDWHLGDPAWWTRLRGSQLNPRQVEFEFIAYSQGSKFGVFHLAASSVENTLRCLLRALAPEAAKGARGEFKAVYECLLRTHLHLPHDDLLLLDLVRLTRNTMHNAGVHLPPSRRSERLRFQDVDYDFGEATSLEFVTWRFVLDRIGDLQALLDRVVRADPLWTKPDAIAADWADAYQRARKPHPA